jgi:magnesium transporter
VVPPSGTAALFWLLDQVIARAADVLERVSQDVDALSALIFAQGRAKGGERPDLVEAIGRIGRDGDTTSKVRESLHTLQRVLLAIGTSELLPASARKEARTKAKALNRDVHSLMEHTGFVTSNVNLLLDATLGMINIEQTNIIKTFSVLAIVFLPPTMIASIYGMNFDIMPEIHWRLGYPFALLLMVASAVLPYWFFKHKRWL